MSIIYKIQELCLFNGITIAEIEKTLGYSNGSIKKSSTQTIRSDRVLEIAGFFDVTPNYLLYDESYNTCPICSLSYDPLKKDDVSKHLLIHENFIKLRNKLGFLMNINQAASKRVFSKSILQSENSSDDKKIYAYESLLHCDFAEYAFSENYEINIEYSDFIKKEILKRKYFDFIQLPIIQNIAMKYNIDLDEKPMIDAIQDDDEFMSNISDLWELPQEYKKEVYREIRHVKRDYTDTEYFNTIYFSKKNVTYDSIKKITT